MIDVPPAWSGGIDDLVLEANRWLSVLLPADRAQRPKDEVNPRLVRHYTTQGLLPAAGREGRDARYTRLHLLALLALRRLMADGLSGKALYAALRDKSDAELENLAVQGSGSVQGLALDEESESVKDDALSYLRRLKDGTKSGNSSAYDLVPATRPAPSAAAPKLGVERLNNSSLSTRKRGPQKVFRAVLRPGLEVLVGEHFRYPSNEEEWDRLFAELRASFVDMQSS
ncbi:MerR family transcriptional regulator [Deinococcus cavernae]|uniref:MerR family transcriptional regulator n=1 Tax=Deinococcus cavernae TaxID=2320857 RepID=A0A418VGZ1_9DEIO|nr:MerR family transcriptional regulator [Deinococcus cavernae]RJF75307.1 MerR family transcriptional regulator [Deinococcus cavernae]